MSSRAPSRAYKPRPTNRRAAGEAKSVDEQVEEEHERLAGLKRERKEKEEERARARQRGSEYIDEMMPDHGVKVNSGLAQSLGVELPASLRGKAERKAAAEAPAAAEPAPAAPPTPRSPRLAEQAAKRAAQQASSPEAEAASPEPAAKCAPQPTTQKAAAADAEAETKDSESKPPHRSGPPKGPRVKLTMARLRMLIETANLHGLCEIYYNGEQLAYGKKGATMKIIRNALAADTSLFPTVPMADTLESWIDKATSEYNAKSEGHSDLAKGDGPNGELGLNTPSPLRSVASP